MTPTQPTNQRILIYCPHPQSRRSDYRGTDLTSSLLYQNISANLVKRSSEGNLRLELLESYEMSGDAKNIRLTLRKGLLFHDGSEVTANDAMAMIRRVAASNKYSIGLQNLIDDGDKSIRRISKYRFNIRLKNKADDLLERLTETYCAVTKEGNDIDPIHCGPWKIKKRPSASEVILERHLTQAHEVDLSLAKEIHVIHNESHNIDFYDETNPFLVIGHGTRLRFVSGETMIDHECTDFKTGEMLFLRFKSTQSKETYASDLIPTIKEAFTKKANWRRRPLESLFQKPSKFHNAFEANNRSGYKPKDISIAIKDSAGFPEVIERLEEKSASTFRLTNNDDWDAELIKVSIHHPFGIVSAYDQLKSQPLNQSLGSPFVKSLKKILRNLSKNNIIREASYPLKDLIKQSTLVPVLYIPTVVRTNLSIEGVKNLNNLLFANIRKSKRVIQEERHRTDTLAAIGSTVQMFAHDVKKPLSMVTGLLSTIAETEDAARIKDLANKYIPEVKKTIYEVNNMLQDIIEIGSEGTLTKEPTRPESLIETTLKQHFLFDTGFPIKFSYDLQHSHQVDVDTIKISRVLTNLVSNAVEAMVQDGRIWFKTRDAVYHGTNFIKITCGNNGKLIPEDMLTRIFDMFYTSGKKKGTGLGLAISKKIIKAHGGNIWCESTPENGTEFTFLLPASKKDADYASILELDLPKTADSINDPVREEVGDHEDKELEPVISTYLQQSQKEIKILIVDDEPLYLNLIRDLIERSEDLSQYVRFISAKNAATTIETWKMEFPEIIILDVNLGPNSKNGFTIASQLRDQGCAAKICIHSNMDTFVAQRKTIEAGADLFLPKPVNKTHLLQIIASALHIDINQFLGKKDPTSPKIAIIDDDYIFLELWEGFSSVQCHTFSSPEEFLYAVSQSEDLLDSFDAVIIDFHFPESELTGLALAQKIKEETSGILYLATDRPVIASEWQGIFSKVLPKDPHAAWTLIESDFT